MLSAALCTLPPPWCTQALAQQAAAHTAALAQQAQQQEDSCSRLAAAAAAEAQLRSQLGALQEDNVQLRRQVEQVSLCNRQ